MNNSHKTTVIVAFYNNIKYLRLVLAGFEIQTASDFEVIIADDGSNNETLMKLNELLNNYSFPITHLWQEDKGFRKNKILNKAILASRSEHLIFIDGDCIPHPEFVKEHINNSHKNICLTGRRVNLSKHITELLSEEKIKDKYLQKSVVRLIYDGIAGNSTDIEKGFYFESSYLRNLLNSKKRGVLGCNFSLFKNAFIEINGFDERYEAPSIGEDSDVQFRLELNGIRIKSLNNIAVQYHLFHKIQPRPDENLRLFEEVRNSRLFYTPFGISR